MVFSSIAFIFYFLPLFILCYYLADKRYKNAVILCGSIIFYAWGAPAFIFVILATTFADFYIVRLMAAQAGRARMALLCFSLCINLGLLFYFKYSNFFVENVNLLLARVGINEVKWTKLILPIGISFYTFETITYVVDVYRKVHKPLRNFWDYQLYIILFPKLIAGPIIRFHDFADQIYDHTQFETPDNRLRGLYRFFIGLAKKVLIANVMGANADLIFNMPQNELGTLTAWAGALSYTFQIYFDFSGYSDMAIGLGLMMGFRFPENFNNPYTSLSITDFWRRWHITLGSWMRNYLYIPLGGNRVNNKWRLYLNLWLVFLASGLWHGAAWGFVIWGAYHGFFLVIERLFLGKWLQRMGKVAVIYTFPVVMIGWVFFKTEYLHLALGYFQRMLSWHADTAAWKPDREYLAMLAVAAFFSFFAIPELGKKLQQKIFYNQYSLKMHFAMAVAGLLLFIISAGHITTASFNPFIYFRF
ncbi:MAG: putative rane protein involved in D-alanine export [Flavipsychrobacter sp.]|jgi:alginate O-acetyltransferase complex protein AlgI|nr:putative rane protein involved in D-alanine export [Flavipsychrobacter sp.]